MSKCCFDEAKSKDQNILLLYILPNKLLKTIDRLQTNVKYKVSEQMVQNETTKMLRTIRQQQL